ncbi:MAG: hypothetical protein ACK56Q_10190 [Pirellulaceae bacterium]
MLKQLYRSLPGFPIPPAVRCNTTRCGSRFYAILGWRLLAIPLTLHATGVIQAQEDPFGEPAANAAEDPFGAPATATGTAAPQGAAGNRASLPGEAEWSPDPVIRNLRQQPARNHRELARGVLYLSRLQAWEDLANWIAPWIDRPLTPDQAADMVSEIGADGWLATGRVAGSSLSEEQRRWIDGVLEQASLSARDPKKLKQQWDKLSDSRLVTRKEGALGLMSAGSTGLAYLLQQSMTEPKVPIQAVGGTLREFQSEGVAAAKAAHALAIPEARQRLLPILAAMPGASYLPELVSGIYDAQLDPPTRSYLASVMESRLGHLPGQTETLNWLGQQLKDQFHTWKIASQTDVPADRTVWRIDGGKLQDVVGDERQLAAGQTLQTALMMLRSADLPEDIAALPMALALEALAQFPPASQSDPIVALKSLVPHDRWNSVTLWPQVYQAAGDSVLPRAAYQALRQMESLQSNDQVPSDAIAGSLVDAARHGAMALRYAATSQLAPRWLAGAGTVAGASQSIADNLQEMSRLEGAPLVLIAGRDASLRSIATRALKPLGIRTAEVNDARELLRWVEQPNPVEAILAVDRIGIGDLSEAQWVQKLRAHRRTRDIPIGLLSNDIPEAQDWVLAETPRLFRAPMPGSIEAMDQIWQQCQRLAGGAPVDAAQRWQWKSVADRILAEVARKPPNQRPAGTDRWPLEPWDGRVEWEPNQLDHDKKILPVSQTSKNTSN